MDYIGIDLQQLIKNNIGILLTCLTIVLLYYYYTATYNYFKNKGIKYKKPTIIVGNIARRIFLKTSFHEFNIEMYRHFDGLPYGGYFEGRRPLLLLRDPDLIKTVMIKDFENFVDRITLNTIEPVSVNKMLINLKGKEWKNVRAILTPTFSSGKLRGMEKLVQECGRQIVEYIKTRSEEENIVEMKEFIGRYTLEVIGSCAFGLDCASLKDPNAQFVKDASRFLDVPLINRMFFFFVFVFCPHFLKFTPITLFNREVLQRLSEVVTKTKMDRKMNSELSRNDFLQLLINAAQKEIDENSNEKWMTEGVIQAQAILFLFAGFETSSTLLSFASAVLCEYPDIQDRVRKEINDVAGDGKDCTYDMLNEFHYMEKVICETLRLYSPVSRIDRVCTKPYTLPGTNIELQKGDNIAISISGVMMDPTYYPDPEKFDPERFSPEEKAKRPSHLFLPFGAGPRNCIGLRFALMTSKFALFYLLKNYKIVPCSKTEYPVVIDKRGILLKAKNGIWVKLEAIK